MKVLELFGGIGACTQALKRLGIEVEIVDYVEIDKYAVASYNTINGTNFEPQDITKWDKNIEVDLIMHGSPCQDISLAGQQAGADEGSGTRSSLMYETIRIVKKLKPKYVIWENVKNLISKKHKHNFENYIQILEQLGYKSYWQVLNAKDYGIPQNRERVFTISIRDDIDKEFTFPPKQELKLRLKDMLEDGVDEKYYLSEKMSNYIVADNEKWFGNNDKSIINKTIASAINTGEGQRRCDASNYISDNLPNNYDLKQVGQIYGTENEPNPQAGRIYDCEGISPTMDSCSGENRMPKVLIKNNTKLGYQEAKNGDSINLTFLNSTTRRGRVGHQVAQTLQVSNTQGVVVNNKRLESLINKTQFEEGKVLNLDLYNQTTNEKISQCLTEPHHNSQRLFDGYRIRKLTPKECWRLMGFSDEAFEKASQVNSNTQLYKQAGNSIVVNVLEAIFKELLEK